MRPECDELQNHWLEFAHHTSTPPFLHHKDREYLDSVGYWAKHPDALQSLDLDSYLHSARFGKQDGEFHFSLIPAPYSGDLHNAQVVVLLLNPGLAYVDYYAEYAQPKYRERLRKTLGQDFQGTKFPFLHLDPEFCWAGGFRWWEAKLRAVLREVANSKFKGNYYRALEFASQRLASIELIPYHSATFTESSLTTHLPSAQVARSTAKQLARRARKGELAMVVTRQATAWGVAELRNRVVCYTRAAEARSAYLTPDSRGGQVILRALLKNSD